MLFELRIPLKSDDANQARCNANAILRQMRKGKVQWDGDSWPMLDSVEGDAVRLIAVDAGSESALDWRTPC